MADKRAPKAASPFEELAAAARDIPVDVSPQALGLYERYVEILLFWRQRLSLTAATTPRAIVLDHILDSLHIVPYIRPGQRVADIGSGAGFPGIPVAIARPEARFVLIESRRRKTSFLREVVRTLGLANVVVVEGRAEDLPAMDPEPFDVVVCRALGPAGEFLDIAPPILKSGGQAIAMKGPKGRGELLDHPGFAKATIGEYRLPSGAQHLLLVYRRH